MADEPQNTPTDGAAPPAAPTFDADALASQVAEKLKDQFQRAPARPEPARPAAPAQPADPMVELIGPYIAPVARQAQLAEESATDAVEFYGAHPDLTKEDRQEIEQRFRTLKQAGVPFKREDIYRHYLGENIDKAVDARIKARDEKARRAADAGAHVGPGSPDKDGATQIRDPHSMSTADLGKALEGVSF